MQRPLAATYLAITAIISCFQMPFGLAQTTNDPLPSWRESERKQAVIAFVQAVSDPGSPDYVEPNSRIATFDNDGTLWGEKPVYVQAMYAFDRVNELAAKHPEWKQTEPFASVLRGDIKSALSGGEKSLLELVMATHSGMTTEQFEDSVTRWITTAKHPKTDRLYTEMVYQPMLELLAMLREHQFKTFIVSGGGIEFMRPWVERVSMACLGNG